MAIVSLRLPGRHQTRPVLLHVVRIHLLDKEILLLVKLRVRLALLEPILVLGRRPVEYSVVELVGHHLRDEHALLLIKHAQIGRHVLAARPVFVHVEVLVKLVVHLVRVLLVKVYVAQRILHQHRLR
jgi:hypothetical protein